MKKNYLFYFVHPAKFHLFRYTINELKRKGHNVDIIVTGRPVLIELVQNEGWDHKVIFPNGRRMKGVHIWISAGIYLILTIFKLLRLTWNKKYTLMFSDDLASFVGRIIGVPTITITDDDLSAVPEASILFATTNYIFAPNVANLQRFNKKKIGFDGYKATAHLHPNIFSPDKEKLSKEINDKPYFFIRTVSATSTHDVGKRGLQDDTLERIIDALEPHGRIIINSERETPEKFKKYEFDFNKSDIAHYIFFSKLFISDSTTMCAEAALLGTPAIEIDDWFSDFTQYHELNRKYSLLFGFSTDDKDQIISKINELLEVKNLDEEFQQRRAKMLEDKIDVSAFMLWICEEFPESAKDYMMDKSIQRKFK